MIWLSTNSSNKAIFTQNEQDYEIALKNRGYKEKPLYKVREDNTNIQNWSINRKMKISWFPYPYGMAIAKKNRKIFFVY